MIVDRARFLFAWLLVLLLLVGCGRTITAPDVPPCELVERVGVVRNAQGDSVGFAFITLLTCLDP